MAGILPADQRIGGTANYVVGSDLSGSTAAGSPWRPTHKQVREADGRLNNILDAAEHDDKPAEQKRKEEEDARELLSYASWKQHIAATFSQDEVLLGTIASLAAPPLAMRMVPATLGRVAGIAARVGVAAATNVAITGAEEAVLHATQETRTAQDSAYTIAGAAVLGGVFQGAAEGVGRALGKPRAAVGPQEQFARQALINQGTSAEAEVGKAFLTPSTAPLQSHNGLPNSVRLHNVLADASDSSNIRMTVDASGKVFRTHEDAPSISRPTLDASGKDVQLPDHQGGAAFTGGMLGRGHDTPATFPFEGVPGQHALDSTSPIATSVATATDRLGAKITGDRFDVMQTYNSYMLMSKNQSTRALGADLLPLNTATRVSESGAGNPMPLSTKVESFKHMNHDKLDVAENKALADYKAEMGKMTPDQHQAMIDEISARWTNGDTARAYEIVDQMRTNAARSRVLKGSRRGMRDDPARSDFNKLAKFAGDNGYDSVLASVGRHAKFLNSDITNNLVERGNRAGAWNIDVNADRGISETYGQARLWNRDKILEPTQGSEIPEFVRVVARFHNPEMDGTPLDQAWSLYHHFRDQLGEFDNFEFRGATGGPDSSKAVKLGHLPTNAFIDFLENDAGKLARTQIDRSARAIVPREHFGSPEWSKVFNEKIGHVHQEAENAVNALKDLTPEAFQKEAALIRGRAGKDVEQLRWALDRALGVPEAGQGPVVTTLKNGMNGMMLGKSLNANLGDLHSMAIVDAIKRVAVEFPNEIYQGVRRAFDDPANPGHIDYEQARRFGIIQRHYQYNALNDGMKTVADEMAKSKENPFVKGSREFADFTHIWSGMKAFNDAGKKMFTADIGDVTTKYFKGTLGRELKEIEKTELNRFGLGTDLDNEMSQRIAAQMRKHGNNIDGIDYPNHHMWDDAQAAEHYNGFMNRAVKSYVLEPDATTRLIGERGSETFSLMLQFTSFIRAAIDKQIVPAMQAGPGAITATYMKLIAWNFAGAITWEWMYGMGDMADEKTMDKMLGRAVNNTLLLPSSLLMTMAKVAEPVLGTPAEWFGVTEPIKFNQSRGTVPIMSGAIRAADAAKGIYQAATVDTMSDAKKEKLLLDTTSMAAFLNTPLVQVPLRGLLRLEQDRNN